ncbi:hypothetical protein K504DRAFT_463078 [Pleomassaria siparia CBS 279.74]|uniref:Uncharacterized protein n=1 Tax=Pleomassaria siparia CBS 279.74 TaxID=1314801 RepID=A0A6G1JUP1_9PLEO|nr:hypothetical protein K504DRAFT_463078 [Pleomassaria siparia CBS 279.74]
MFIRPYRPAALSASARLSCMKRDTHRHGHLVICTHSRCLFTSLRPNAGSVFKPFWFERQARSNVND